MKAIKIILGIIVCITLLFVGTGLLVKETKYTVEVEVDKPVEEVFAIFENPKMLKKWLPEIKSIEPINVTPQKLGSTYKIILDDQGQGAKMVEKIRAYVPNEKLTLQFTSSEMLKVDDYNFTAQEGKTKIIQNTSILSNSFVTACVFPWFKGRFKDLSQDYLNRFKELAESATFIITEKEPESTEK